MYNATGKTLFRQLMLFLLLKMMMLGGSDTSRGKTNSNNIINDLLSRPNAPVSADISESLQMKI